MGECESRPLVVTPATGAPYSVKAPHLTLPDEPRRSARANKGSHSDRWQEVLDSARQNFENADSVAGDTVTDAGTVATDSAQDGQQQQDEDRIRCVCGQTEEVDDEDKDFVQCDQCLVWQHNQCVGLPSEIPENQDYFCEQCRPDLHQKLLKEVAAGKFSKKQKSKVADKKRKRPTAHGKGKAKNKASIDPDQPSDDDLTRVHQKRQRSVSLSDVSIATDASDSPKPPRRRAISPTIKKERAARSSSITTQNGGSTKATAKIPLSAADGAHKASAPSTGPFSDLVEIMDPERRKIASALIKLVGDAFKIATENEGFSLAGDVSVEQKARTLGLRIEFAMFDARLDVRAKFRQLSFNLKDPKNPFLRQRVLDESLPPAELVQMSSEDMANPELKAKTEALREESLKQSVLVQDTGPRLRRTHKGEEYVEGPDAIVDIPDSVGAISRPRVRNDSNSPLSVKSPSPSDDDDDDDNEDDGEDGRESPAVPRRERSDSNFDIKNVWNHIEPSPGSDLPAPSQRRTSQQALLPGDDDDEDILGLLEGDRKLPNHYIYGAGNSVWDGQLLMQSISDLRSSGTLLGGPKTFDIDWDSTLTPCIQVDGRIPKPDATKYLCHQKFSQSKAVFAMQLRAEPGKEAVLEKLYKYFLAKDRYGVIKPGKTRLRDGYIVPLPLDAALPEFITMLPSFNLPADRTDMLLAVLVIEKASSAQPVLPKKVSSPSTSQQRVTQSPPKHVAATEDRRPVSVTSQLPLFQGPPAVMAAAASPITPWSPPPVSHGPQQQQQQQQHYQHPTHPVATALQAASPFHHQNQQQQQQQVHLAEDPYMRRVAGMGNGGGSGSPIAPGPVQLDQNAQAVLVAFLRAHPEIASNAQVISSPQLMARLLDEFVRNGGMRR